MQAPRQKLFLRFFPILSFKLFEMVVVFKQKSTLMMIHNFTFRFLNLIIFSSFFLSAHALLSSILKIRKSAGSRPLIAFFYLTGYKIDISPFIYFVSSHNIYQFFYPFTFFLIISFFSKKFFYFFFSSRSFSSPHLDYLFQEVHLCWINFI